MQIRTAQIHRIRIPFKRAFGHALSERTHTETIIVILSDVDGTTGCGEILPRSYLTGETIQSVLDDHLPALLRAWLGRRFETRAEVVEALEEELGRAGRRLATFGGLELAVLDLVGKSLSFPVGEILGAQLAGPLDAGVVIGFDIDTDALPKHCAMLRLAGRRHIKVKVGRDDDVDRVKIVRKALGSSVPIRIDANGAWTAEKAIEVLQCLAPYQIASVEQPVPAGDIEGMCQVRTATAVPVMADESLCTIEDAQRLINMNAADIFNIRLGKCGGFLASLRLVQLARAAGLGCHLGTLVGETGILSRAAEIFGRRVPGFACLEGKGQSEKFLEEDVLDPMTSGSVETSSGLGVGISFDRLARRAVEQPRIVAMTGVGR